MRILVQLALLSVSITYENLTEDENQIRLSNCGYGLQESFETKPGFTFEMPPKHWLAVVRLLQNGDPLPGYTIGTFISSRHILTSSKIISDFYENKWNKSFPDDTGLAPGMNYLWVQIEESITGISLAVGRRHRDDDALLDYLKVESALVLHLSGPSDVNTKYSPMIIELNELHDGPLPCLSENSVNSDIQPTDNVQIYDRSSLEYDNKTHINRELLTIDRVTDGRRFITVKTVVVKNDSGGPLIRMDDDRKTVIGIAAKANSSCQQSACGEMHYFDLRFYAEHICKITGICPHPSETSFTMSSTSPPSTSSKPKKKKMTRKLAVIQPEEMRYEDEYEDEFEPQPQEYFSGGSLSLLSGFCFTISFLALIFEIF